MDVVMGERTFVDRYAQTNLCSKTASRRGGFTGLCAFVALALVGGCDWVGGRTVVVEFHSAEGIQSGRSVYFAGVQVGRTGDPKILKGKARVPVQLFGSQRDSLPSGTVFAIGDDPTHPGARCLLGYAIASMPHRVEDGSDIYQGVSTELELALLFGAEKARELMEQLSQAYP